jgi:hypothetical protein
MCGPEDPQRADKDAGLKLSLYPGEQTLRVWRTAYQERSCWCAPFRGQVGWVGPGQGERSTGPALGKACDDEVHPEDGSPSARACLALGGCSDDQPAADLAGGSGWLAGGAGGCRYYLFCQCCCACWGADPENKLEITTHRVTVAHHRGYSCCQCSAPLEADTVFLRVRRGPRSTGLRAPGRPP